MKLRSILSLGFAAVLATGLLGFAGCDPATDKTTTTVKNGKADVGELIFFWISGDTDNDDNPRFNPDGGDVPLEGVKVTMTDESGEANTATTDKNGLWMIEDLTPGGYTYTAEKDGYKTNNDTFAFDLGDWNADGFISFGVSNMVETPLTAWVAWNGGSVVLSVLVPDQNHGYMDFSAIYSQATDTAITVTFSGDMVTGHAKFHNNSNTNFNPTDYKARHELDRAQDLRVAKVLENSGATTTGIDTEIFNEIDLPGNGIAFIAATDNTTITGNNTFCVEGTRITPIHGVSETLDECFGILVKL